MKKITLLMLLTVCVLWKTSSQTIDCTAGIQTFDYCYDNNAATAVFTYTSSDGSPLNLTFNTGNVENNYDELVVLDSDGTPFPDYEPGAPGFGNGNFGNAGDLSGLTFQSTGDTISFYINADGSVSCGSNSGNLVNGINYSVACATCINPQVTYSVIGDCINGPQFLIEVDVTDLGSATALTLTDNQGSASQNTTTTNTFTFGPYLNQTDVVISVANDDDANCTVVSNSLTQELCTETFVDCNNGAITLDYCYGNGGEANPEILTFTSLDGTPLNLTFNAGNVENNYDELVVLDSDGTPFPNYEPGAPGFGNGNFGNAGDLSGLTFQSTGDSISFYINSDLSVSCAANSPNLVNGINYSIACATCINPQATYSVVDDCINGPQFLIEVDVTDLGSATSLTISNNINGDTTPVTTTGSYQIGPFPFLVDVIVSINNDQDNNCVINSSGIELLGCPPDNDNCEGAITAVVNADESCNALNPGTILGATPSGVPDGSCAGSTDDDIWYEFVALGEQQIISIINITGGTQNIDHALYEGTCGSLIELYCTGDLTSLTPALTIGNTYYIRIFSGGSDNETSVFDLCINTIGDPAYCLESLPICPDPNIDYPSIVGDQVAPPYLDYGCLGSQPDPQWNTIQFDQGGDYVFSLDQTGNAGNGLDIDFIIWGPFTDQQTACYDLTTPNIADCSFSPTASETITLNNVPDNSVYIILITNYSQQSGVYNLTQDSGPVNGVNCDVVCDVTIAVEGIEIEDDIADPTQPDDTLNYCGYTSVELSALTAYNVDEYIWYHDGFIIPGVDSPTYTATESGTYEVQVLGGICDQTVLYYSALVQINFYDEAPSVADQEIALCDEDGNGTEDFDLEQLTTDLNLSSDFVATYHTSTSDANQAINPVSSPYTSSGEVLILRIEDVNAAANNYLGCRKLSEVTLIVNSNPTIGIPGDLIECSANDTTAFDLTNNDNAVLGALSASDYTVSYYNSLADAETNTNPLASLYTNISNPQTIYVRLEDNSTGCYSIADFDLIIYRTSSVGTVSEPPLCDLDNDGSEDFDLNSLTASLGLGSDFVVTYHETSAQANAGTDAVTSPFNSSGQILYIRIDDVDAVNDDYLDCAEITQVELIVNTRPIINTPIDFTPCDDQDGNVDGITEFDLTSIDTEVTTDANIIVTYHTSQEDADNAVGSLSSPYTSSGETIYIRAQDNTTGCYSTTSFFIGADIIPLATVDDQYESYVCPSASVPITIGLIPDNFTASEVSISWTLDGNPITGNSLTLETVLVSGLYEAKIEFNDTECSKTFEIPIGEFESCEFPQGISPGVMDGINDSFDLTPFAVTELKIFNRNGNLVYSKRNYTTEWYGQTNDGEELPVGTYFYTVVYENGTKSKSAWVYINR